MTVEASWENPGVTQHIPRSDWKPTKGYRLHVLITKDDKDLFSAIVLNLPGTGSSGSTEEEAIERVKEAARGTLEVYAEDNEEIPWKDTSSAEIPTGAKLKWIIMDA